MSETYSNLTTSVNPNAMYNGGLRDSAIRYIVIHHNATTNKDVAMNTWLVSSGNWTSAHYEITDNEIIGCVGENYIAYHAGGTGGADVPTIANPNGTSIGLEHVNSSGAPSWSVSDATLHNSAKLIADICKRYNLPVDRSTIKLHREITSTACPGGLDIDTLVAYAQAYANGSQVPTHENAASHPQSQPKPNASTNAISVFQNNGNAFSMTKSFRVDNIAYVNGIWQMINYQLAGDRSLNWTLNGIPLSLLNNLTRGNQAATQIGDSVVFNATNDHGTIDAYDIASNGVGITYGSYGIIWFDADMVLSL